MCVEDGIWTRRKVSALVGKICAMEMNGLKGFSLGHIFTVSSCWWAVTGSGDRENVQ